MGRYTGKQCRLVSMSLLICTYFLVELVVGYATNSMALIADSFHMLSDLIALVVAFVSVRIAPKRWTKSTFGWARAEILGALVNAVFLLALCFSILVHALKRFVQPTPLLNPVLILYVGSFGLVMNLIGIALFVGHGQHGGHGHDPSKRQQEAFLPDGDGVKDDVQQVVYYVSEDGKSDQRRTAVKGSKEQSKTTSSSQMNMRGIFLHILADTLGSVIVIASALIVWLTDWPFRLYIDPMLSVIMVVLISRSTWPLLKQSSLIMLQTVPTHIEINALKERLMKEVEGVHSIQKLHIWQLAEERVIASIHIVCKNLDNYIDIALRMKEFFHREGIHSITVQPEAKEKPEFNLDFIQHTCYGTYRDSVDENSHLLTAHL